MIPPLLLAAALLGAGGSTDSLVVRVPRATSAPVLDGRLDDEIWRQAAVLDQWVQVKPGDNVPPEGRTVAYLAYDRTHFYVAVRAWDDRAKVQAVLHERDAVIGGPDNQQGQDYVAFRIDTFNDQRQSYGIAINPLGLQGDGIEVAGTGFTEWDGEFDSKGVLLDDGWSVEVLIPLATLRYPSRADAPSPTRSRASTPTCWPAPASTARATCCSGRRSVHRRRWRRRCSRPRAGGPWPSARPAADLRWS